MVKPLKAILPMSDGHIDLQAWLNKIATKFSEAGFKLIRQACVLAQLSDKQEYLKQSIEVANRLFEMDSDYETIAASIAYYALQHSDLQQDDIEEHLGKRISKLVKGVIQMDAMTIFENQTSNQQQIDTVREMLLAMVDDVRVVLIKLAERCYIMQSMEFKGNKEQQEKARQTQLIYAPLASRLGVNEIKWELEDLAFRYLETEKYKVLAKAVNEKRIDRERYVIDFMATLSNLLNTAEIPHEIMGRAKHIFSIYKKMLKKDIDYSKIHDITAVRILVNDIEACYKVLSIVHNEWEHLPKEFDDYIATPKKNGYQSIHTVTIGPNNKLIEIQIRTHKMHEENELGVAAHWLYKEGSTQSAHDRKIAWLRELLAWEKELTEASELPEHLKENLKTDRVYVFTPNGDLVSLAMNSTPLDFAYQIHSEIGHRCKGAKINGKIIPLTYKLKTGDKIEIITGKTAQPSLDWLSPHTGYVTSSRAKAKIHSWFKKHEQTDHFSLGQAIIERELKKLGLKDLELNRVARKLHLKTIDNLTIALGNGELRIQDFLSAIEEALPKTPINIQEIVTVHHTKLDTQKTGITVEGVSDLLTHIAGCCKPLPGDIIVGYVTQGHGITIHRKDCANILRQIEDSQDKIFDVSWGEKNTQAYSVELKIEALDRQDLLYDITSIISQAKIHLLELQTQKTRQNSVNLFKLKLGVNNLNDLTAVIARIQQLSHIYDVKRL